MSRPYPMVSLTTCTMYKCTLHVRVCIPNMLIYCMYSMSVLNKIVISLTVLVHAHDEALAQTTRLALVPVSFVDDAGSSPRLAPASTFVVSWTFSPSESVKLQSAYRLHTCRWASGERCAWRSRCSRYTPGCRSASRWTCLRTRHTSSPATLASEARRQMAQQRWLRRTWRRLEAEKKWWRSSATWTRGKWRVRHPSLLLWKISKCRTADIHIASILNLAFERLYVHVHIRTNCSCITGICMIKT